MRKENQPNEIYFSSYFNSPPHKEREREYHDGGGGGVGVGFSFIFFYFCLRFRVDEFFLFDTFIDFHACLLLQNKLKIPMQKKRNSVSVYTASQTHAHIAIEMRCKQSDIFAKFMYLRHRVILSVFGRMCSRTHTLTHFICVTSALSTSKQRSKQEVTRNEEQKKKHQRIFNVKPTNGKFVILV